MMFWYWKSKKSIVTRVLRFQMLLLKIHLGSQKNNLQNWDDQVKFKLLLQFSILGTRLHSTGKAE